MLALAIEHVRYQLRRNTLRVEPPGSARRRPPPSNNLAAKAAASR